MICQYNAMTNQPRRPGGKRPGSGRKPKGPISKNAGWLQARISDDLQARLKREAARNGRSLSQEAQVRLKGSFDLPPKLQKQWGPKHIAALAQLVSRVTRSVEAAVGADPEKADDLSWHLNPYTHAAVTAAIAALLEHYKPAGPVQTPDRVRKATEWAGDQAELYQTPQSRGRGCAGGLLDQLAGTPLPPKLDTEDVYAEGYYVLPDIRQTLGEPKK
jgi:hypothetical protein